MLGWLYLRIARRGPGTSEGLARACRHIPLWFVRKLARAKLVRTLRHVWTHSPVQRRRWEKAGVHYRDLRSPRVLTRIPFLTGHELAQHPEDCFCVPEEELIHVVGSSGTTGLHKRVYLTHDDFHQQVKMLGTYFRRFPGVKRAAVMLTLDDPTWSAGTIVRRGLEEARIFALLANTSRDLEAQIELLREHHIDLIISTPTYVHRLALESPVPVGELGVKVICVAGLPFTEDYRRRMEDAWGAQVIDSYGGAETACGIGSECVCRDQRMHVAEADYWVEVVDPETGELLPDGEEGELVITTLSRRGMPLVRYRSADIAALVPRGKRCPCGLPLRKMTRVRGRTDHVLNIGTGNNVYPEEVDAAVFSVAGITDYQLVVEKDDYRDVLHLTVESADDVEGLREALTKALMTIDSVKKSCQLTKTVVLGRIETAPVGSLAKGRQKVTRIVDRRGC
ncbi:MAG TPA: AMP-binding protein [Planctomycetota bacterium]|nr:AMP-binding protein [Planctomycetota bacterium]